MADCTLWQIARRKRRCRVWCPVQRALVHLHPLPESGLAGSRLFVPRAVPADAALNFLGPIKPAAVCAAIAAGDVDPLTHKRFVVLSTLGVTHVVLEGEDTTAQQHAPRGATAPPAFLGQANMGAQAAAPPRSASATGAVPISSLLMRTLQVRIRPQTVDVLAPTSTLENKRPECRGWLRSATRQRPSATPAVPGLAACPVGARERARSLRSASAALAAAGPGRDVLCLSTWQQASVAGCHASAEWLR
jgi:hypothetical protein